MSHQNQLLTLINKHLPEISNPLPAEVPEADLHEAVRIRVKHLLDNDMERLLHMLYRIDVRESRVKEILATAPPDDVDNELTDAILMRIREKLEFRAKYGSGD